MIQVLRQKTEVKKMNEISRIIISVIENGFTVYDGSKTTFCQNKTDVIKKLAEMMNVEIKIEIKEKD